MEIRKLMCSSQPRQKVSETPSQQISWLWWHVPVIPAMQEAISRRIIVQVSHRQNLKTLSKN
jgi:hypothetical protein